MERRPNSVHSPTSLPNSLHNADYIPYARAHSNFWATPDTSETPKTNRKLHEPLLYCDNTLEEDSEEQLRERVERVNSISESLMEINPFMAKRMAEKSQNILMLEILPEKESTYLRMSLRSLLELLKNDAENNTENHSMMSHGRRSSVGQIGHRDLRRLEFQFNPNDEPSIVVRKHCVLFLLDPLRAIIMSNRLMLIVPEGADSLLNILETHMKSWVSPQTMRSEGIRRGSLQPVLTIEDLSRLSVPDAITFESHAYEALLTTALALYRQEYDNIKNESKHVVRVYESGAIVPVVLQKKMTSLKNRVNAMITRCTGHKKMLLELLDEDENMALMNLSKLKSDVSLYQLPLSSEILDLHEDIQVLIESSLMDCNSMLSNLDATKSQMTNAEDLAFMQLDTARNNLLTLNTTISVCAVAVGFGSYVTGAFGMNLDNTVTIQETPNVFVIVCAATFTFIITVSVGVIMYFQSLGVLPAMSGNVSVVNR